MSKSIRNGFGPAKDAAGENPDKEISDMHKEKQDDDTGNSTLDNIMCLFSLAGVFTCMFSSAYIFGALVAGMMQFQAWFLSFPLMILPLYALASLSLPDKYSF